MLVNLDESKQKLFNGKVIATPTDTLYGVICDLSNEDAVEKIYELKGREDGKPLIAFIADPSQIKQFIQKEFKIPDSFVALSKAFWPGALTLILPIEKQKVPYRVRSGGETLGFRIPDQPELLELIRSVGPLASTSANRSGEAPLLTKKALEGVFGEEFPVYQCPERGKDEPSTILLWSGNRWKVLRVGVISTSEIKEVIGKKWF